MFEYLVRTLGIASANLDTSQTAVQVAAESSHSCHGLWLMDYALSHVSFANSRGLRQHHSMPAGSSDSVSTGQSVALKGANATCMQVADYIISVSSISSSISHAK